MIKFFRKIRQNLLIENKTGKYFKYAVGEIVLVVIGILIALQINNWNEERKEKEREKKMVRQLLDDTKNDSIFYNSRLLFFTNQLTSYQAIIDLCNDNIADINSISFTNETAPFSQAADQSLVKNNSTDYNNIENEAIKKALRAYLLSYTYTNKAITEHSTEISIEFSNFLKTYDLDFSMDDEIVPLKTFSTICDDSKISGKLKLYQGLSHNAKAQTERFLKDNSLLIKECKNYLND